MLLVTARGSTHTESGERLFGRAGSCQFCHKISTSKGKYGLFTRGGKEGVKMGYSKKRVCVSSPSMVDLDLLGFHPELAFPISTCRL